MKADRKLDEIKKGPWKAEEDEVLINHVKKYGPRDWSSIRSKGLLQRTGKSCRLRWVNKLRPNLKNGCKFSAEEERTVIDLQGQFGNKWARIATYLPGRTDNDVKNFWSSRQKRLARILHNSNAASSSSSKSHRFDNPKSGLHVPHDPVTCPEVANLGSAANEVSSSITELYPLSFNTGPPHESVELMPLPDLAIKPELQPPAYVTNLVPTDTLLCPDSQNQYLFPQMVPQPHRSIGFTPENQELFATIDDPYFYDIFGPVDSTDTFPLSHPFFEPLRSCRNLVRDEPDVFFDDLPADMFDEVDSLRSPVD